MKGICLNKDTLKPSNKYSSTDLPCSINFFHEINHIWKTGCQKYRHYPR